MTHACMHSPTGVYLGIWNTNSKAFRFRLTRRHLKSSALSIKAFTAQTPMILLSKEYIDRTFTRATVEDKHGDLCANDIGPPDKLHYSDQKAMSKEEEEAFYDKQAEIELDSLTF